MEEQFPELKMLDKLYAENQAKKLDEDFKERLEKYEQRHQQDDDDYDW